MLLLLRFLRFFFPVKIKTYIEQKRHVTLIIEFSVTIAIVKRRKIREEIGNFIWYQGLSHVKSCNTLESGSFIHATWVHTTRKGSIVKTGLRSQFSSRRICIQIALKSQLY